MVPKHANPYLLPDQTTVVSRAALRDSDDEADPVDTTDPERAQLLARLENILKRSIEDALPVGTRSGDREDGDIPRKKKRRKVEKGAKQDSPHENGRHKQDEREEPIAVPFRLLSGASQPKPIVLAPKPPPVIIPIGPALEDTKEEAERRASRAREVAVDYAWVMNESRKPPPPRPNAHRKLRRVAASLPSPEPPLLALETPSPAPKPPRLALADPEVPVKPSPHLPDTSCCPIITVPPPENSHARKPKRRKGKSRQKPAIQPTFWRPPEGLGGKSAGYAWGYGGSWPIAEGQTPRYHRDTMRKAVYA